LELVWVTMIALRHSQIAEHELGEEREVEAEKDQRSGEPAPPFRIHLASHLRPPEVDSTEVAHYGTTNHDVVEVGNDEIGVVNVHVHCSRCQKQAIPPAQRKQADEAQGVQHGCFQGNRSFMKCGGPVEYFNGRGNRDHHAQQREDHAGENRLPAGKHMVPPYQKSQHGNSDAGEGYKSVSKNALASKAWYDFAHYAHAGQNHNVDRRMRVKPKQVL